MIEHLTKLFFLCIAIFFVTVICIAIFTFTDTVFRPQFVLDATAVGVKYEEEYWIDDVHIDEKFKVQVMQNSRLLECECSENMYNNVQQQEVVDVKLRTGRFTGKVYCDNARLKR